VNRACKRQLFWSTLNLYAAGLKANAHRKLREVTYQLLPCSTFYRHLTWATSNYADKLKVEIAESATNKVHWIDNFARHFAVNGIFLGTFFFLVTIPFLGKDLFKKTLWTAHGVKLIPAGVDMKKVLKDGKTLPATPPLDDTY